jgi:hypothetical protein
MSLGGPTKTAASRALVVALVLMSVAGWSRGLAAAHVGTQANHLWGRHLEWRVLAGWYTKTESNDRFYLKGAKVDNADLLDGRDASSFLGAADQATDAARLDGLDSSAFALSGHNHDDNYAPSSHTHSGGEITSKVGDADRLDGLDSSAFAGASHTHLDLREIDVGTCTLPSNHPGYTDVVCSFSRTFSSSPKVVLQSATHPDTTGNHTWITSTSTTGFVYRANFSPGAAQTWIYIAIL